jgi:hypothetical protein
LAGTERKVLLKRRSPATLRKARWALRDYVAPLSGVENDRFNLQPRSFGRSEDLEVEWSGCSRGHRLSPLLSMSVEDSASLQRLKKATSLSTLSLVDKGIGPHRIVCPAGGSEPRLCGQLQLGGCDAGWG